MTFFFLITLPSVSIAIIIPLFWTQFCLDSGLEPPSSKVNSLGWPRATHSSQLSLQLANVLHKNQLSRLRWFRKSFPTAGNSWLHTGCDLINTVLYFSSLLNAATSPLCVPLMGCWLPHSALPRLSLSSGFRATSVITGAERGAWAVVPAVAWLLVAHRYTGSSRQVRFPRITASWDASPWPQHQESHTSKGGEVTELTAN